MSSSQEQLDTALKIIEASWKPIAAILIPVVVAFAPNFGLSFIEDRKVDSIIVQEALAILKKPSETPEDEAIRDWAITVIEHFSATTFSTAARESLRSDPGPIADDRKNPDPLQPNEVGEALAKASESKSEKLLKIALGELGRTENPPPGEENRVMTYNATLPVPLPDTLPWNSQFLNWVVEQGGYQGTDDARSRSWETWGKDSTEEVGEYIAGCVMVAWRRDSSDWTGIAGVYTGLEKDGRYRVIGGNIYNAVDATWLDAAKVVTCRLPPDWAGPAQ